MEKLADGDIDICTTCLSKEFCVHRVSLVEGAFAGVAGPNNSILPDLGSVLEEVLDSTTSLILSNGGLMSYSKFISFANMVAGRYRTMSYIRPGGVWTLELLEGLIDHFDMLNDDNCCFGAHRDVLYPTHADFLLRAFAYDARIAKICVASVTHPPFRPSATLILSLELSVSKKDVDYFNSQIIYPYDPFLHVIHVYPFAKAKPGKTGRGGSDRRRAKLPLSVAAGFVPNDLPYPVGAGGACVMSLTGPYSNIVERLRGPGPYQRTASVLDKMPTAEEVKPSSMDGVD